MIISKFIEIDTAHRVPNHKSKCKNLHGHRYKIEVAVDDKVITEKGASDEGMVIDFGDLKEIMMKVIDEKLDHTGIFSTSDPDLDTLMMIEKSQLARGGKPMVWVDFIPTAENIASYIYKEMKPALIGRGIQISGVAVCETPTSVAVFRRSDEPYDISSGIKVKPVINA